MTSNLIHTAQVFKRLIFKLRFRASIRVKGCLPSRLVMLRCGAVAILASCASPPDFKSSRPLESARSLPQFLALCQEYSLPPRSTRPIVLKPMLKCIESALDAFPENADPAAPLLKIWKEEFFQRYSELNDAEWSDSLATDYQDSWAWILVQMQKDLPSMHSIVPTQASVKVFPRTSRILEGFCLTCHLGAGQVSDPRLQSMIESTLTLAQQKPFLKTCKAFKNFMTTLAYLNGFWKDMSDMSNMTNMAHLKPAAAATEKSAERDGSQLEAQLKLANDRYRSHFSRAQTELKHFQQSATGSCDARN